MEFIPTLISTVKNLDYWIKIVLAFFFSIVLVCILNYILKKSLDGQKNIIRNFYQKINSFEIKSNVI